MSLDHTTSVDAIGIEHETGFAVLTIADSWDWTDERKHLVALQDKLNAYFEFIDTGQIWETYPAAQGKPLVIDIVSRFPLPQVATDFMKKAVSVAAQLNIVLRQKSFQYSSDRE